MRKIILLIAMSMFLKCAFTQNVGIGTTTPEFKLSIENDGSLIAKGTLNAGIDLTTSGVGSRMIWYPKKAAFRAGYVDGTQWNKDSIGRFSFAAGQNTKAIGINALALGANANALKLNSFAIGENVTASGSNSTAIGTAVTASGDYATAVGVNLTASGAFSTALGFTTTASGYASTSMGTKVSTNNKDGAFIIGDKDGDYLNSESNNLFSARFISGYKLYTTTNLTVNAFLQPGSNSWSTASDERLKENFEAVDGEKFLNKIASFNLTSWNYKKQNPEKFRHYGPMAQDFFAAFGKDKHGFVGNDTTINQSDFIGVNFIAIQALEKRTTELSKENKKLTFENEGLRKELIMIKNGLQKQNEDLVKRLQVLEDLSALVEKR